MQRNYILLPVIKRYASIPFYCELKEEVDPDVLQEALNQTIETFPTFLMVLRKGLFGIILSHVICSRL